MKYSKLNEWWNVSAKYSKSQSKILEQFRQDHIQKNRYIPWFTTKNILVLRFIRLRTVPPVLIRLVASEEILWNLVGLKMELESVGKTTLVRESVGKYFSQQELKLKEFLEGEVKYVKDLDKVRADSLHLKIISLHYR